MVLDPKVNMITVKIEIVNIKKFLPLTMLLLAIVET